MFKVISLQNFRGFREAQLVGLSRINVITGLNGTGKTSFLEAAFLICGGANASHAGKLYAFRGNNEYAPDYDKPFRWLFRHLDPELCPTISASTSQLQQKTKKHHRQLVIKPIYSLEASRIASTEQSKALSGVSFEFTGPLGKKLSKWGWIQTKKTSDNKSQTKPMFSLGGEPNDNPDHVLAHFVSPYFRDIGMQDHDMVVRLTKEKRTVEAVNALKMIEPALVNLVPLTEHAIATVYADTGEKNLLPISLLGSGLSNCLHILLPSILYKNATILVDEFEDGLHHSVFAPLLDLAFKLARENNNQLFITSHSNEFLQSLITVAASSGADDVSFFRLSKKGIQGVIPKYSLTEASSVIESNLDIR